MDGRNTATAKGPLEYLTPISVGPLGRWVVVGGPNSGARLITHLDYSLSVNK